VLVLLGLTVTLSALIHQATFLNIATGVPIPLVYAAVGVVIARHQPRNPVGWILILFVVLFLISVDAGYYAVLCYRMGYHGLRRNHGYRPPGARARRTDRGRLPIDPADLSVVRGAPGASWRRATGEPPRLSR
jgi:hypothetical protein